MCTYIHRVLCSTEDDSDCDEIFKSRSTKKRRLVKQNNENTSNDKTENEIFIISQKEESLSPDVVFEKQTGKFSKTYEVLSLLVLLKLFYSAFFYISFLNFWSNSKNLCVSLIICPFHRAVSENCSPIYSKS